MPRRQKQLIALAAAVLVAVVVTPRLLSDGAGGGARPASARVRPAADATTHPRPAPGRRGLRSYAVAVPELDGLPPDAAPGTRLELWVAWDPPITKRPQIRLLIEDAILERIVPSVTGEGPATALLLVAGAHVSDLLYADRYGSLSVTVVP